jgi:hypothetical protein
MNSIKGEHDICCGHGGNKILWFGIALLIIGLMMQNKFSIPDILIVVSLLFIVKGMLTIVSAGRKG